MQVHHPDALHPHTQCTTTDFFLDSCSHWMDSPWNHQRVVKRKHKIMDK